MTMRMRKTLGISKRGKTVRKVYQQTDVEKENKSVTIFSDLPPINSDFDSFAQNSFQNASKSLLNDSLNITDDNAIIGEQNGFKRRKTNSEQIETIGTVTDINGSNSVNNFVPHCSRTVINTTVCDESRNNCVEKKELKDVFRDVDFSDIAIDFKNVTNNSFKSAKIVKDSISENIDLDIERASPKLTLNNDKKKDLSTVFGDFDFSSLGINLNNIKTASFKSAKISILGDSSNESKSLEKNKTIKALSDVFENVYSNENKCLEECVNICENKLEIISNDKRVIRDDKQMQLINNENALNNKCHTSIDSEKFEFNSQDDEYFKRCTENIEQNKVDNTEKEENLQFNHFSEINNNQINDIPVESEEFVFDSQDDEYFKNCAENVENNKVNDLKTTQNEEKLQFNHFSEQNDNLLKNKLMENEEFVFDSQDDEYLKHCAENVEQNLNLKIADENNIDSNLQNNVTEESQSETNENISVKHKRCESPFVLRSDYNIIGDQELILFKSDNRDFIETQRFIGFRNGNGDVINIGECNKSRAVKMFADIEECLRAQISELRKQMSEESFKSPVNDERRSLINNGTNLDLKENVSKLFDGEISEITIAANETSNKEEMCKTPIKAKHKLIDESNAKYSLLFESSFPKFEPIKCLTSKTPINDNSVSNLAKSRSPSHSMIPCTSTPKSLANNTCKLDKKRVHPKVKFTDLIDLKELDL